MISGSGDRRYHAFTLVELLVVIAIIIILAAILFPVLAEARNAGRQMVCLSNMRQIGMAMLLYLPDHHDTWFPAAMPDYKPGFAPQQMWIGYDNNNYRLDGCFYGRVYEPAKNPPRQGAIDPYLKDHGVKRCPNMPERWQMAYATNWFNPGFDSNYYRRNPEARGNEYGPATKYFSTYRGQCVSHGAPNADVHEPAYTLVMWEHLARVPVCNFLQPEDWFESPPPVRRLIDHFHFLHRAGANALWADGYAKRIVYFGLRRPMFSSRKDIYPGYR